MSSGALVLGLLHGAAIALLGLGIVLVYQANRFLNLAYAQLGAAPALLMARLVLSDGWAWWLAFPVSIAFGAGLGLLVEKLLFAQLRRRTTSTVSLLLLSVGVGQLLLALTYVPALGPNASTLALGGYPEPIDSTVRVGGVILDGADITTCVLVPLVIAGITGFLRFTSLGKKVRAAASNADAARLLGISTSRVSLLVWGIAGGLSTVTAILLAPSEGTFTAAALGPYLLLLALGAATFGAFTSIPMTLAGGLVLGVLQQVTLELTSSSDAGKVSLLVAVLVMVMVRGRAIGQAFSVSGSGIAVSAPLVPPASLRTHWSVTRRTKVLACTALTVAVLLPHLSVLSADSRHFQLALITCYALVAVSLCLLVGWSGQVSLGHFAIVGLGAFVTAQLADSGVGLVVIVLLAGLAGAVLMVIVGLPALRVPGLTLAVTSLGLAVIAPIWLLRQPWISDEPFGMPIDGLPAPLRGLPDVGSVQGVYYLGLVLLTATLLLLGAVRGTAFGRAVLAVRDNETAAAAFGLTPAAVKTGALAVSGFIAGIAGVVWAGAWETAAPRAFSADLSLLLLAVPVIGGVTSLAGSVAASTLFFSLTFFVSPYLARVFGDAGKQIGFQLALAGLGVVGTLLAYPGGMAAVGNRLLVRWWRSLDRIVTQREVEESEHRETPLVVTRVEVAFGGVQALRGASIEVRKGEIVGLIGPNGAGKSTLMNVVSGVVTADRASVRVFGTELIGLGREFRAAHGVGRSFQDASLFAGLTVREVIQVAADRRHRSGALSQAFRMPWARAAEAASRADADEVIDRLGLGAWADSPLSELSTGTRRICDLAAQAAARPAVLLLDEPTAGVAQRDAEAFGPLLRRLRDELDCSILVIEHDMGLLMGLCDRLYALDAGAVIAEGTPDEVRANPQVVASYLGTSETAIERSGPLAEKRARTPRKRTPRARLIVNEET